MIEFLSDLVVSLAPTLLVLGLAWAVFRAVGVRVVWREDK